MVLVKTGSVAVGPAAVAINGARIRVAQRNISVFLNVKVFMDSMITSSHFIYGVKFFRLTSVPFMTSTETFDLGTHFFTGSLDTICCAGSTGGTLGGSA